MKFKFATGAGTLIMEWKALFLRALIISLCATVAAHAAPQPQNCVLLQVAKLDMRYDAAGGAYVPMTISGTPVNLLIDTGGIESMLTPSAAQALGLKRFYLRSSSIGYEGWTVDNGVNAPNIKLGGLTGDSVLFAIAPDGLPLDEAGTLSNSILSYYDLEFDFAKNKFTMFDSRHCDGAPRSLFTPPLAEIPFTLKEGHEIVSVQLDGRTLDATVDTGSSQSIADWETIKDIFGIAESSPGVTAAHDLGAKGVTYHYPFKTLNFDDVAVSNPDIVLAPRSISNMSKLQPQLIIGMDILRRLHIYIAHHERLIYVGSPNPQ